MLKFIYIKEFPYDDTKFEVTDKMKKCFDDHGYLLLRLVLSKEFWNVQLKKEYTCVCKGFPQKCDCKTYLIKLKVSVICFENR